MMVVSLDGGWCYALCDSVVLPILTMATFGWTAYQEYRHHKSAQ